MLPLDVGGTSHVGPGHGRKITGDGNMAAIGWLVRGRCQTGWANSSVNLPNSHSISLLLGVLWPKLESPPDTTDVTLLQMILHLLLGVPWYESPVLLLQEGFYLWINPWLIVGETLKQSWRVQYSPHKSWHSLLLCLEGSQYSPCQHLWTISLLWVTAGCLCTRGLCRGC